jgi:hypothetical protein
MRSKVAESVPEARRGNNSESASQRPKATENARNIATPPRRGKAFSWTWRPSLGLDTQPRRIARSLTSRVAAKESASERANKPKNRSVKIKLPFWPRYLSSRPCSRADVNASFLQGRGFGALKNFGLANAIYRAALWRGNSKAYKWVCILRSRPNSHRAVDGVDCALC